MGRLEKIVVVTVLFLVAIILGVSLNSEPEEGSNGPLARERRGVRRQADPALAQAPERQGGEVAPNGSGAPLGVMNATVPNTPANGATNAPAQPLGAPASNVAGATNPSPTPAVQPAGTPGTTPQATNPPPAQPPAAQTGYIVSKEGLEPTASEDFMLYTWKAGDSYRTLAQRFYGSPLHVARLRAANEGRDEAQITAGEKIMVSVQPAVTVGVARAEKRAANADAGTLTADGTYVVKSGDALGSISKEVYGSAKHWQKIYAANKDVIGEDANKLKVGMKLRIPQI